MKIFLYNLTITIRQSIFFEGINYRRQSIAGSVATNMFCIIQHMDKCIIHKFHLKKKNWFP